MVTKEQYDAIVALVEDGELDEYMIDLLNTIDARNARRQDDVLRLVKSVYGDHATVVSTPKERSPVPYSPASSADLGSYDDDVTPEQLGVAYQREPVVSSGASGGGGGTGFSPVRDPMSEGGGEDDSTFSSTGAQIG